MSVLLLGHLLVYLFGEVWLTDRDALGLLLLDPHLL